MTLLRERTNTKAGLRGRKQWLTPKKMPYILLSPVLLLFAAFKVYPFLSALWLSFTKSTAGVTGFAGLQNYSRLFSDPLFYTALSNTAILLVVQVPIMLILAILLAVTFNSLLLRARAVFRLGYFLPIVMGLVAYGILFRLMLDSNHGVINMVLNSIGISSVPWLIDPLWAKISIALAMTWHYTGFNSIIYLAQRQSISEDLYEAASVDGAGPVRRFWNVTLPGLRPAILLTVTTSTIGTLQLFDEPYVLTNGGPNNSTLTVGMYLYQNAFKYFDFGYASAIGFVLVLIVIIISAFQFRLLREES